MAKYFYVKYTKSKGGLQVNNTLSEAINFSLDVQEKTQNGKCLKDAIIEALKNYPGAEAGDDIKFKDGSKAILTSKGFRVE